MEKRIDATDMKIIRLLQKNGRMSNTEIAKQTGVSETTVRYRLQRLTSEDFIQIVAMVNPLRLGFGIEGIIRIKADIKAIDQIAEKLKAIDALYFVARSMGAYDFDAEYFVKTSTELRELIDTINTMQGVTDTDVSTVLDYVKERYDFGELDVN